MRRILLAILPVIALAVLFAAPAEAQKAKAKKEFDKGVAAMESHDYKTALTHFQAAYDAAPHWMVLAHLGNCYAKLNDPVNAIKAYEQFLKDGGDDIDAEQRTAARQNLEEQRKKVGVLVLLVKPKESTVSIDGESYGNPPFEEILLKAGPHHIIVVRGDEEVSQDFNIEAGKEKTIKIYPRDDSAAAVLAPTPAPTPAPAPASPKTAPSLVEEDAAPFMATDPDGDDEGGTVIETEPSPPPPPAEGSIKIVANVEGATVELDGAAVGTAPFEQTVAAGEHQVTVSAEGYLTYAATVTVAGGMASAIDVRLVTESEKPPRTNVGFIASASVAGVGLVTGVIGWGIFGKNNATVNNFEDEMNKPQWAAWSVSNCESATKPDGTSASTNDADWNYYCNELVITRNDAEDKAKVGLGLGVAGTVLFVAGGTMAALFYAKPELFFGTESDAEITLVPVATNDQMGLVLGGRF